ncbi:MAG: 3'(2'),5'-bisphosphate nucleotidase CysQ [Mesorhizobium sp.]|nr:3'(2'),5'-bisphosphate nucleotidase CysQ [Mesorhizobium sp.]
MPEADRADAAIASDLAADLALISDAARQGGAIAMRYFGRKQEIWMKGGTSPVSEADYAVDTYLRETLRAARPDYGWLSEETADSPDRLGSRRTFVVDPIDGTRAYLDGRDIWCVSIAVVEQGQPIAGVLECPARGEFFSAISGGGAWLDGKPAFARLAGGRPSVGGPKAMVDAARPVIGDLDTVSYVPSLAYRVAMVAAGRIDATFIKANAHDWDLAAAGLVLAEAGGGIVNRAGFTPSYAGADPRHGSLVAGSAYLLEKLAGVLADLPD